MSSVINPYGTGNRSCIDPYGTMNKEFQQSPQQTDNITIMPFETWLQESDKDIVYTTTTTTIHTKLEDKETQTHNESEKIIEKIIIHIVLPHYTYSYTGLLEDAPHIKNKMTEINWASHMESTLIKQRNNCQWVKERNRARDTSIELLRHYQTQSQTIPFSWDNPLKYPSCRQPDRGSRCPGDALPKSCLQSGNLGKNWRVDPTTCSNHCYYKYCIDIEEHNKSCKICNTPK